MCSSDRCVCRQNISSRIKIGTGYRFSLFASTKHPKYSRPTTPEYKGNIMNTMQLRQVDKKNTTFV